MFHRIAKVIGVLLVIAFSSYSCFIAFYMREVTQLDRNASFSRRYASYFEERFSDIRESITRKNSAVDKRIILAAIDDDSLQKVGRWPWPRMTMAKLVNKLNLFGAKVVSFDVFFSEPENVCKGDDSGDTAFAKAISDFHSDGKRSIVLPYAVFTKYSDIEKKAIELPDSLYFMSINAKIGKSQLTEFIVDPRMYPTPELTDSGALLGHITMSPDGDGVFRNTQPIVNVDNVYLPSMSLITYTAYQNDSIELKAPTIDTTFLTTKKNDIYINQIGETKIKWFGDERNFPTVSIHKILEASDDDVEMQSIFKNNIVFIGSTAMGAHDLRHTPINEVLPGVYSHMNATKMFLDGYSYTTNEKSTIVSWSMLIIGTIIILAVMILNDALIDFFAVNIILAAIFFLDVYYFMPRGYNNKIFFSMFSVLGCYSWVTFINFYLTNLEKQKIRGTFSRYLAPSIVNDLLKNPDKVKLGGEKKVITVFFSDVRDFTSISEKLTPEQLSHALNLYMTMMTDTLFEFKGTLDKYIGDAMVAYWGAPVEMKDSAYWAIKGAIQMIEKLPSINQEFEKLNYPLFKHGIGLNTGECSVGNMGSNQIFSYTALGDNMNLGARLESLCKYYGVQLNVSEYTIQALTDEQKREFIYRTLDKVRVKGKENAVTIFEVLHPAHPLYKETEALKKHEEGFLAYQNQNFSEAENIFRKLLEKFPFDPSFERLLHICEDFNSLPPAPGWDGTYTHKSK